MAEGTYAYDQTAPASPFGNVPQQPPELTLYDRLTSIQAQVVQAHEVVNGIYGNPPMESPKQPGVPVGPFGARALAQDIEQTLEALVHRLHEVRQHVGVL